MTERTMTGAELRRAARAMNIPADKIDAYLREKHGIPSPADVAAAHGRTFSVTADHLDLGHTDYIRSINIIIPWSALVSDNRKWAPAKRGEKAVMILTEAYRDAKERIEALARDGMANREPLKGPLSFVARVYVPDNRRHDTVNFAKITQDALSEIIYEDDHQLHDARWIRAGVDVDAPRAEVTIEPLSP